MPNLYWSTPFNLSFFKMDRPKQLKRSRSNESMERTLKRSKPLQVDATISTEAIQQQFHSTNLYPNYSPLPTHIYSHSTSQAQEHHHQQQQQQQHQQQLASIKSFNISTKSTQTPSSGNYADINGILYNAHVERYGDPERRESWWEDEEMKDVEQQDPVNEYNDMNTMLRQAFLWRRQQQQ